MEFVCYDLYYLNLSNWLTAQLQLEWYTSQRDETMYCKCKKTGLKSLYLLDQDD